jgi:hypothetical protein
MTSALVHDDNVARREDWEANLLDISAEACAIDRSVDDAGRGEPGAPLRRQERERPRFAERRFGDQALACGAAAMGARHVGFGPGLVDEEEPAALVLISATGIQAEKRRWKGRHKSVRRVGAGS